MKKFFSFISLLFVTVLFLSACDDGSDKKSNPPPTQLYLFSTESTHNGNLGGRAGADSICSADAYKPVSADTVHALISVSTGDSIAAMPETYGFPADIPIVAPDGATIIADNWADLIDGSVDVTLDNAGIFESSGYWWSGSNSSGVTEESTCDGWTVSETGLGFYGSSGETDASWIWYDTEVCSASYYLLGIGY